MWECIQRKFCTHPEEVFMGKAVGGERQLALERDATGIYYQPASMSIKEKSAPVRYDIRTCTYRSLN